MMKVLPLLLLSFAGLLWCPHRVASFSTLRPNVVRHRHPTTTMMPTTSTMTPISSALDMASVASSDEAPVAAKMDSTIFTINKFLIDTVYNIICIIYPVTGGKRDYARFFVLETVARVPYFAYLSVLHFRESFGERNLDNIMRTHYAECDNELHHLLIMEELGGNESAFDRNLAHFMAFFYFWYVVAVYMISEQAAYHLSELIEDHAYNTYNKFLTEHEDMLKEKPVPDVAHQYYEVDNPFLFDLFCTVKDVDSEGHFSVRRPQLNSLYDVFVNIRDDEREHWKALCNLVQFSDLHGTDSKHVKSTEPMPSEEVVVAVPAEAASVEGINGDAPKAMAAAVEEVAPSVKTAEKETAKAASSSSSTD